MTLTVFTTTLGDTDVLRKPEVIAADVRYVCFTDGATPPRPYVEVRVLKVADPKLRSREIKILADHPALNRPDVSLWHDAAFQLRVDPRVLLDQLGHADMLALRHPHRDQIADEAVAIAKLGYVAKDVLDQQLATYAAAGFTQTAITSTGLCLRRHTDRVREFNEAWWREVSAWHWRDQMSVDFAAWKTELQIRYLEGHYRDNPYAKFHPPPVRSHA